MGAALAVGGIALAPATAEAALYWTPWVSEEGGGPATACGSWDEGAVGFGCSGSYCDKVSLMCETLPYGASLDPATAGWTHYFSEEHDGIERRVSHGSWYPSFNENYHVCQEAGGGGIVTGIKCSGSYCDNISLECAYPRIAGQQVSFSDCAWSGWISEEQGQVDFGWNRYIVGVQCEGRYCDRKSFYLCSIAP